MRSRLEANTQTNLRNVLLVWVDPAMHWYGRSNGKRGRSLTFCDDAVRFCLAIKGLLDLPLRQAMDATKKLL